MALAKLAAGKENSAVGAVVVVGAVVDELHPGAGALPGGGGAGQGRQGRQEGRRQGRQEGRRQEGPEGHRRQVGQEAEADAL